MTELKLPKLMTWVRLNVRLAETSQSFTYRLKTFPDNRTGTCNCLVNEHYQIE
jgi:hypothetical protein